MNLDDITLGQAKQLASALNSTASTNPPTFSGPVIAQFIGRFIFVCNLEIKEGYCYLTNVKNIRYWDSRENGLGDLAMSGPKASDNIDNWPNQVIPVDKLGPVMTANPDKWK